MKIINFSEKFLNDVAEIEKESFIDPWNKKMFLSSANNSTVKFRILIEHKTLVGYYIINTVADETEILNIAVSPMFRGHSFGRAMIADIKKEAVNGKSKFIFLEVRQSNIVALNLYKSFGFEEIGVRKKYYKNEDAIIMRTML
jgi:ribosomal-protein-alanine N-acetyltransferase